MKFVRLLFFVIFLTGFFAEAHWEQQSKVSETAQTPMEIADLKIKYPDHFSILSQLEISYGYYFTVQTEIYKWSGTTVCSLNDPRLVVELKAVSFSARLKNGASYSSYEPKNTFLSENQDPCVSVQ